MKRRTNHKQNVDLRFHKCNRRHSWRADRNFWPSTVLPGALKSNAERTLKKKDSIGNKRKKWKRKMCTNVSFLKRASWHPSMVKSRNGFCYHFVGAQLERCDRLHVDHFRCKYPPSLQKTTIACLNKIIMRLTLTELCSSVSSAIWLDEDTNLPILRVHYLQVHIPKSFTDNFTL